MLKRFNVEIKTLREGFSEPEFYGDLIYKFKRLIRRNEFFFFSSEKKSLYVTDVKDIT